MKSLAEIEPPLPGQPWSARRAIVYWFVLCAMAWIVMIWSVAALITA